MEFFLKPLEVDVVQRVESRDDGTVVARWRYADLTVGEMVFWDYVGPVPWNEGSHVVFSFGRPFAFVDISPETGVVRGRLRGEGRPECELTVEAWTTFTYGELVPGDATSDGVFDSGDLVRMFQAGEYEDDIPGNSRWDEGDFTFDLDFNTNDLVLMFRKGKYADRQAAAIGVPEPSCLGLLPILALAAVGWRRRNHNSEQPLLLTALLFDVRVQVLADNVTFERAIEYARRYPK